MRTTLRPPRPGQTDAEALALGTSAAAGLSAFAWMTAGLPLPRCAFHAVTGCPCPTCGATRCVMALLHGHAEAALAWNPLVFAALVAMVVVNGYSAAAVAAGLPRVRVELSGLEGRMLRAGCVLMVAANWGYLVHRGV